MNGKRPPSLPLTDPLLLTATTPPPPPPPRRVSLLLPLRTCNSLRSLLQIQSRLVSAGLLSSPIAAGRLLQASAAVSADHTFVLLRHLPFPPSSFNATLKSLSRSPNPSLTLPLYFHMLLHGLSPNTVTFLPLAAACAASGGAAAGEEVHGQAAKRGLLHSVHVSNSLVHMYAACGLVLTARALFDEMPDKDLVSWNSMVHGYAKLGDLTAARELFDSMPERNFVSWNVMINGYLRERSPGRGLRLFRAMVAEGCKGSETTMVSAATACGRLGSGWLLKGRSVHGYFVRNFGEKNVIFETALVDMYSRCGNVDVARRVFDVMKERNLVSWNAMVLALCIRGCPRDGLELFCEMVGKGESSEHRGVNTSSVTKLTVGIKPDEVTFIGVLCACARAGLLTEGKKYFDDMKRLYNITPNFAHYWCMANLHGALGLVQEAEAVLKEMPAEQESSQWSGLFGLCRFHGDIELGERIAKRLIELEPFNRSRYALLWNVYAASGRWEDAHKVKEAMKERGLRVKPGYTLLGLKEIVDNFKLGDKSHPEIEKIYAMLDNLAVSHQS